MHFTTGDDRLNDGSFIQITTNKKVLRYLLYKYSGCILRAYVIKAINQYIESKFLRHENIFD